jgi:urease accessory protein
MTGSARLEVDSSGPTTSFVSSLRSSNPLRLLAPINRGPSVWAFTSSYGGGFVGGDQTRLELQLAPDTRTYLGSQASTKVYRNPNALPCGHTTIAHAAARSLLVLAPDPVQPFAQAHYRQRQEIHLDASAGLVLVDAVSAGRTARDERWDFDHFESRNDVFVNGRRRFLDILALRPSDGPLRDRFRLGRFNCIALILLLGPPARAAAEAALAEIGSLPVPPASPTRVSASPIPEGAVIRIATESSEEAHHLIRHHLHPITPLLGDDPWTRKW